VVISLRVSVQGSNAIWKGGWMNNLYSDTVVLEIADGTQGWIEGEGKLFTAEGVYY
jgi:autotransporter adhesin